MVNMVIKWIVKLIMGSLEKALYIAKKKEATKKVQEAKEKANEAKKNSDSAVTGFKLRLEQYRKQRESNLRRAVNRVRSGSGEAGADNRTPGEADKGSGAVD